ncbi:cysteine proteinase [Plenodomus tracheiphilus IPT5]|uniref:Ubiquitin carboxyl-terminal hydrolase n=1 Tax=Plenodomus tracheiphilus IPT5 TaxID=1408161 RepID=A0A6A7B720_9PLEO|nr:cysteine proteinase [Plenodomus tracheiphilus IPT5]
MVILTTESDIVSDTMIVPSQETSADTTNGAKPSNVGSPNSRKRKRQDAAPKDSESNMTEDSSAETSAKEGTPSAARSPSPPIIDKTNWQGFCEIESDPAYFSVILREMGVKDVTVREVFAMDPDYLQESLPQPIHGLILLFHYREFGNEDQPAECPSDVWFANQLPAQNSCATLAMINILMNSTNVQIGEHLSQFKDFTKDFAPYQRGEALASFDYIKRIHNSFAKKMDILESDKLLFSKVSRAQRLKAQQQESESTTANKNKNKRGTKSRRRAPSTDSATTTTSTHESHKETGHHFIAFLPIGTQVWKLDGLDKQPTIMGTFDPNSSSNNSAQKTWLSAVSDTIAALMAAGDDDYGVIALSQSPLLALRQRACLVYNTMTFIDDHLSQSNKDWKAFVAEDTQKPCPKLLGIESQLLAHPMSETDVHNIISSTPSHAVEKYTALAKELEQLGAQIVLEVQSEVEEENKAKMRRFDTGPVIRRWLEMLAQNGHLEANLHRFMPGGGGGGRGRK